MQKKKKILSDEEIEESVSLAFEDLLELSTLDLENDERINNAKKELVVKKNDVFTYKKKQTSNVAPPSKKLLAEIIINARKAEMEISKSKWIDLEKDTEEVILNNAKKNGKSAYDSDVLRELILERQKKKREANSLSSIINNIKK